ncbi:YncE family protein [Bounagaea algeriensis]
MRRLLITCLAATLLAGCGNMDTGDPLQATDQLSAATPAPARAPADPQGTVHPAPAADTSAFDTITGTLLLAGEQGLTLLNTNTNQQRTVPLGAPAANVTADDGTALVAVPDRGEIAHIDIRSGHRTDTTRVPGGPVDATRLDDGALAVAQRDAGSITIHGDGRPRTAGQFDGPARLFAQGGEIQVLDRLTTSLTSVDPRTGDQGEALRAGQGATNGVADRYDRVLTVDTRKNELLAFDTNELILKQRYPLPGSPYGIAYDARRDLAWITLTDRNEVLAYDVAGGEPEPRHRFRTVAQPHTVAVDSRTGAAYVTSAGGAGVQVVKP